MGKCLGARIETGNRTRLLTNLFKCCLKYRPTTIEDRTETPRQCLPLGRGLRDRPSRPYSKPFL